LNNVTPNLEPIEGWNQSLATVKSYDELPVQAKHYLDVVENLTNAKISIISTGPDRTETIYR
jgi:adenylosuccinate synthase